MLRRRDVPQLVDHLARPVFVYRMARAVANEPYSPHLRRSAERRMADAERDIQSVVNELVSNEERLWADLVKCERHRMRYPSPVNEAQVRFREFYRGKVDGLLDALAILRGGDIGHAATDVRDEWRRWKDEHYTELAG